ncbi:MAG TPA: MFS transporter [Candidatus Acidoferrales bacterium]|nr:MFS transporter [Candidatus Acidoferrales bacterium]
MRAAGGATGGGRVGAEAFRPRAALLATILGSAMVFLDGTVVNVALPRIGRELPAHLLGVLEAQTYVYNAYLLTLASLLVLAGAISDRFGRRRIFLLGVIGFAAASVLCGLAVNMEMLIVSRMLQGAAGALLVPGSLAILRGQFQRDAQGRAIGMWTMGTSAVTVLGPLLGGILVDVASWRLVFLINVPLAAAAVVAARAGVAETPHGRGQRLDWAGAALVALACGGLAFGAIYGEERGWRGPGGVALVTLGACAVVGLALELRRSSHPLVPRDLFRARPFTVINISTFLIYGGLYSLFYWIPLFSQGVLGYTATAAGAIGLPSSVALILLSTAAGRWAARRGPRFFLTVGPLLMALGASYLALVPSTSRAWRLGFGQLNSFIPPTDFMLQILPGIVTYGVGIGLMVAPLTAALMASVSEAHAGVASAVNNAVARVGPQLIQAGLFSAVTAVFVAQLGVRGLGLSPMVPPAQVSLRAAAASAATSGFHLVALICAVLFILGAAVNLIGLRGAPERLPAPVPVGQG